MPIHLNGLRLHFCLEAEITIRVIHSITKESTFANHSITQFALFTQKAQAGQNTSQPEAAFLLYICFYSQYKNCLWWHPLASLSLTEFTDTKYQEALMSY